MSLTGGVRMQSTRVEVALQLNERLRLHGSLDNSPRDTIHNQKAVTVDKKESRAVFTFPASSSAAFLS